MKRSQIIFRIILMPIDILMILLAFALAYYIRSQSEFIYIWPLTEYLKFILIFLPIWIAIFTLEGLYNIRNPKKGVNEFYSVVISVSTGIAAMVIWLFLSQTTFFSRLVIAYGWLLCIIFVLFGRWIVRFIQIILYKNKIGTLRLLVVGNNKICYDLIKAINKDKSLGYELVGILATTKDEYQKCKENINILGSAGNILKIYQKTPFDVLVLTDPNLSSIKINKLIEFAEDKKLSFKEIPNLFQVKISNAIYSTIGKIPIINFRPTPLEGWGTVIKRIFDIIVSLLLIILFSPVMLLIAIAIKLESPGPIIYKSERINRDGKKFYVHKFRYMKLEYCTGAQYGGEKAQKYEQKLIERKNVRLGPVYKISNDPRKTKVGNFIEKYKLDELPQFFDIFVGKISMVGPRPHQPREVAKYQKGHLRVFHVKPGLTGLPQTSGSSDLSFNDEVKLDLYYIENWSLWLDLKIILKTPAEMFRKRKNIN